MENSSKALLIAAAVLIVILIVTISIKILSPVEGTKEQVEEIGETISGSSQTAIGKLQAALGITTGGGNNDEVITNYTAEDIEKDKYLYAIGKTAPTYVVAKFNEDYTEVTITKNGTNSDGMIKDFSEKSPMEIHRTSLKIGIIEQGIINTGARSFFDCEVLTSIMIPDSVTSIEDWAFYACDSLTSITIPDSVAIIGKRALGSCEVLKSVTIPNSVTSIGEEVFGGCHNLITVTLSNSITSIEKRTFLSCNSLKNVIIPNSVINIGITAFGHCRDLESVTIPDSVTNIGEYGFYNCISLRNITIPDSVKNIGNQAFDKIGTDSIIYCQSQAVADLLIDGNNYQSSNTIVVVDPSKFK